jgi:methionyl-tRNA formyltransferase
VLSLCDFPGQKDGNRPSSRARGPAARQTPGSCPTPVAVTRILFIGTPELARASLRALLKVPQFQVVGVVTQPDRPKGRDLKLQASPVKELALRARLPIHQPERARDEQFIQQVRTLQLDLIAVAAYGQILPPSLLEATRFGCVNVHTSLLPKYRGAAPIQWAILEGETQTGVTIMKMDAGLDTGDILAQETTPIYPEDDSQTLHDRLADMGASLLVRTIPEYLAGKVPPQPQSSHGVSYARKIRRTDGQIDWTKPARVVWNRVRGLIPWPGAFTFLPDVPQSHLLKIWKADVANNVGSPGEVLQADKSCIVLGCGEGSLRVLVLQREGSRKMSAQEFIAGHNLQVGLKIG